MHVLWMISANVENKSSVETLNVSGDTGLKPESNLHEWYMYFSVINTLCHVSMFISVLSISIPGFLYEIRLHFIAAIFEYRRRWKIKIFRSKMIIFQTCYNYEHVTVWIFIFPFIWLSYVASDATAISWSNCLSLELTMKFRTISTLFVLWTRVYRFLWSSGDADINSDAGVMLVIAFLHYHRICPGAFKSVLKKILTIDWNRHCFPFYTSVGDTILFQM